MVRAAALSHTAGSIRQALPLRKKGVVRVGEPPQVRPLQQQAVCRKRWTNLLY